MDQMLTFTWLIYCKAPIGQIDYILTSDWLKVYYMKQTISNACGTVALMHSVINNVNSGVIELEEGPLKTFIAATRDQDSIAHW